MKRSDEWEARREEQAVNEVEVIASGEGEEVVVMGAATDR